MNNSWLSSYITYILQIVTAYSPIIQFPVSYRLSPGTLEFLRNTVVYYQKKKILVTENIQIFVKALMARAAFVIVVFLESLLTTSARTNPNASGMEKKGRVGGAVIEISSIGRFQFAVLSKAP